MMSNTCTEVIRRYLSQLRGDFGVSVLQDGCILSTPFVRPDGEGIELEMRVFHEGRIDMSDMGDTLGYLYVNGLTLSKTLMAEARAIAKAHGVSLQRNRFHIEMNAVSMGIDTHEMIQAILGVSSLIHKRRPNSRVLFDDEVESFIIQSGVTYDVGFPVPGHREEHTIKFHVNSGSDLLIHPLSAASTPVARSWAERLAYRFADIQQQDSHWDPIAVLDDRSARGEVWSAYAFTPIQEYAVRWSQRDELALKLEATKS